MWNWGRSAVSPQAGGADEAAAAAASTDASSTASASAAHVLAFAAAAEALEETDRHESVDAEPCHDQADAPNQSGAPEEPGPAGDVGNVGDGDGSSGCSPGGILLASSSGSGSGEGGCGSCGKSDAAVEREKGEPAAPSAPVSGEMTAREQVLLCASDELECLFMRLGVEHFSALECVCRAWREAIRAARLLCHQSLLYPSEPYPLPRTTGGIKSPSAVAILPFGVLAIADTGERAPPAAPPHPLSAPSPAPE